MRNFISLFVGVSAIALLSSPALCATVTNGELANGFRWTTIADDNPKRQDVSIRLLVKVGSLMEKDNEAGAAHFIEHMAFNGSKHIPAGKINEFFETLGMRPGAHANAETLFDRTVYSLDFASSDRKKWQQALLFLADVAHGLTLSGQEIQAEKAVILAEKKAQETPGRFARLDWMKFLFKGTPLANDIIGVENTISGFTPQILRHFYQTWYRPERMHIVVAGNVDTDQVANDVKDFFGSMVRGQKDFDFGLNVNRQSTTAMTRHRDVPETAVSLCILQPPYSAKSLDANLKDEVLASVISRIFNDRLSLNVADKLRIWNRAGFADATVSRWTPAVMWTAVTQKENWRKVLQTLVHEEVRAFKYPVDVAELKRAVDSERLFRERQARQASDFPNRILADLCVNDLSNGQPCRLASEKLTEVEKYLDTVTPASVNDAVKVFLSQANRRIQVSGSVHVSENEVLRAYRQFRQESVSRLKFRESVRFPYLTLPKSNVPIPDTRSVSWTHGQTKVTAQCANLDNDLRLRLMPLTFNKGKVSASLIFGNGYGEDSDKQQIAKAAKEFLAYTGIGKLSLADSQRLRDETGISCKETITRHYNIIYGEAPSDKALDLLTALYTRYVDLNLTADTKRRSLEALKQMAFSQERSAALFAGRNWEFIFSGDAPELKPITVNEAVGVSIEAATQFLTNARDSAQKLLVVAGDFDQTAVLKNATDVFSRLPRGENIAPTETFTPWQFPVGLKKTIELKDDRSNKAVLMRAYKAEPIEVSDQKQLAVRSVVEVYLREKLRKQIREKLGAAYSPAISYRAYDENGNYGYYVLRVEITKDQLQKVEKEIDRLMEALAQECISQKDLDRIARLLQEDALGVLSKNRRWYELYVKEERTRLPYIDWKIAQTGEISRLTVADVNRELQMVARSDQAQFVVQGNNNE